MPNAINMNTSASNNANGDGDNQDFEGEMGLQPVRRPVSIEKDVTSLSQKKRVSSILRSPDFKEELETVVTDILQSDRGGGHVIAQAIANAFSPRNRSGLNGVGCVSPINDLTGADALIYSKGEKLLRCKLAALYRIVDLYGWTSAIFNHITVRVSQEHEHFLINPFGLLYHEVSASKLIKVNMQGDVMDPGSTTLGFNLAGFTLHSAIHSARPDIHCVIHVHTSDVIAVSCMDCGLLPISQEALIVGEVSYHSYHGILVDNKEKKSIQKHLGPNNKVMFLRNHGLVACGETVEEAFHYLFNTMSACASQVRAMSCVKPEKLIQLDRSQLKQRTFDMARQDITVGLEEKLQWGVGEMLFEAHIRMLDDMGYRSGYPYRNPVILQHKPRVKSDVELPATAIGHTPVLPEELEDARGQLRHNERSQWVTSPHQYTRIVGKNEEEQFSAASSQNGDTSPKNRTKWKRAEDGTKSTSVRISNPNQFVPTNTDPREVLETRKSIRGRGRYEYNRPGPQSQLLHNVSPDASSSGVQASSKAIIEKGNVVDLVTPAGPPNPFNMMSDDGLKQYKNELATGVAEQCEAPTSTTHPSNGDSERNSSEQNISDKSIGSTPKSPREDAGEGPKSSKEKPGESPESSQDKVGKGSKNSKDKPGESPKCSQDKVGESPKSSKEKPGESPKSPSVKAGQSPKSPAKERESSTRQEKSSVTTPKSPGHEKHDVHQTDGGKKKKKRPLSFLKKKK